MNTWYCPVGGLEYRCLTIVGWKEVHRLEVDGEEWVKLEKPVDSGESLSCLH